MWAFGKVEKGAVKGGCMRDVVNRGWVPWQWLIPALRGGYAHCVGALPV